jgi:glucose/arabinose dehydrogenase
MKLIIVLIIVLILTGFGVVVARQKLSTQTVNLSNFLPTNTTETNSTKDVEIIAQDLDTPWAIDFLPNGDILVTERMGNVRLIQNGVLQIEPIAKIGGAREIGEGGLLGIAIDPEFENNNYIYLYYTYQEQSGNTLNRVVRMEYKDNKLVNEEIVADAIPGASNHNGGRIKFGPDGNLYIGTGDAQDPSKAQDASSWAGKILRVANGNTQVYSLGHRNVQGLAWDKNGQMFASEHGRSGIQSGLDELNLIVPGANYGWPQSQGNKVASGTVGPIKHSGNDTWAPSGMAYLDGSIFFSGLRGQALYEAVLDGNWVIEFKEHFKTEFGRIREVVAGPDQMLYITTSNRDGRGNVGSGDDKIIKINPKSLN